ncbi:hypothetical protein PsorP6_012832 [Peronosclerospora sorghi]|uniref:Uncharacterized protein n=1 Tax=Peronosclerospora sorghi TaxID=230839 RepID=A0ACC0WGH5_9STRA|nr:hypothetical protein PsorP6_012832 [Peronosclerospora sorghi]
MPMELVSTRIQTDSESDNILQIMRSIVKENGVGEGGEPIYFVLCLQTGDTGALSSTLMLMIKEKIQFYIAVLIMLSNPALDDKE